MNLRFDVSKADGYKSNSQIARVLSEDWVLQNSYCPSCETESLQKFENNMPVADFLCCSCKEEFELKSKSGKISNTITDGAYSSMLDRINSANNPNFFFLTYSKGWEVTNFLMIPKQFFTPEIILKRKPLSLTAQRAGWVGCNIDIAGIADAGKVFMVRNSKVIDYKVVRESFNRTLFLRTKSLTSKGWILDIMHCLDQIKTDAFWLEDVYRFEEQLKQKYPNNRFIKDKIRQQLQILRDRGIIEFAGNGHYRKLKYGDI